VSQLAFDPPGGQLPLGPGFLSFPVTCHRGLSLCPCLASFPLLTPAFTSRAWAIVLSLSFPGFGSYWGLNSRPPSALPLEPHPSLFAFVFFW
jgi:hypothetical protein